MRQMGMTLFEMSNTAKQLYELLEAGEIDEAILNDTLESIGAADKLKDYMEVISSFEHEIAAYDAEIARMKENKRVLERRIDYMRSKVADFMLATGQKSAQAGTWKLSMRETKSVEIENPDLIPLNFMREVPAKLEPDKKQILAALKSGEQVSGASLKIGHIVTAK